MDIALVLIFLSGISFGITISAIFYRAYHVGTLRIDKSDPEDGPYMFLELSKGISDISSKKNVVLRVNTKNFMSHK